MPPTSWSLCARAQTRNTKARRHITIKHGTLHATQVLGAACSALALTNLTSCCVRLTSSLKIYRTPSCR